MIAFLLILWWQFTTPSIRCHCVIIASVYSVLEYTWTANSTVKVDGSVKFSPFADTCRAGHTTFEQWWMNIIYAPILIHLYHDIISPWYLRVALFPFNIWLLEIIEGYVLAAAGFLFFCLALTVPFYSRIFDHLLGYIYMCWVFRLWSMSDIEALFMENLLTPNLSRTVFVVVTIFFQIRLHLPLRQERCLELRRQVFILSR